MVQKDTWGEKPSGKGALRNRWRGMPVIGLFPIVPDLEGAMPRGDKSKYTDKQKRQAEHIEDSYEEKGVPKKEAEARAWATVNKQDGGGKKPGGSGRAGAKK